jgi:hypothetical protein
MADIAEGRHLPKVTYQPGAPSEAGVSVLVRVRLVFLFCRDIPTLTLVPTFIVAFATSRS